MRWNKTNKQQPVMSIMRGGDEIKETIKQTYTHGHIHEKINTSSFSCTVFFCVGNKMFD